MADGKEEEVFLFVNPKSGGKKGEVFMKVDQPFRVPMADGKTARLRIYSLLDGKPGKKPGFIELRNAVTRAGNTPVRMIVGGGDGTVMWAVGEAEAAGVDVQRQLYVGVVPLGTGNDFARASGWGGKNPKGLLDNDCEKLIALVTHWCTARPEPHDIWQVEAEVDEDEGHVVKVDGDKQETPTEEKIIKSTMINYCSFGQDSKVGMRFDKNRTSSQVGNYGVYVASCCMVEANCCEAQKVDNLFDSVHNGTSCDDPVIFDTDGDTDHPKLVGDPEMLTVVNISSYAGGLCHLWQDDFFSGISPAHETLKNKQHPGDGNLELVTVPNIAEMATDQVVHAAGRVFSGAPLHFEFCQDDAIDVVAYFNVDGEFYKLVNPLCATITQTKRLQVLHKVDKGGMSAVKDMVTEASGQVLNEFKVAGSTVLDMGQRSTDEVGKLTGSTVRQVQQVATMTGSQVRRLTG